MFKSSKTPQPKRSPAALRELDAIEIDLVSGGDGASSPPPPPPPPPEGNPEKKKVANIKWTSGKA